MGDDELLFDMGDGDKDITDGIDGMPVSKLTSFKITTE